MKVTTYVTIYDDDETLPRWTLHHNQEMVRLGRGRYPYMQAFQAALESGLFIDAFIKWNGYSYELSRCATDEDGRWTTSVPLTGETLNVTVYNDGTTGLELR